MLHCDCLPRVWQPDLEAQRFRRLTDRRAALVSDCTWLKNRLRPSSMACALPPS